MARGPTYGGAGPLAQFLDRLRLHGLEAFRVYYGVYRAEVKENDAANNQGVLRVRVPAIGDGVSVRRIAYPAPGYGGNGFGAKFIPPVGSFVWVRFEGGRPDCPVWMGGMWPTDGIIEDFRDPKSFGFFFPGGHHLLFDERDNEARIRLKHSNGAVILFDKDGNIDVSQVGGKQVRIGGGADEWMAKGETLKALLEELIDAINAITVPTAMGPSGVPNNAAQFVSIRARLQRFLSQVAKVK
jgi:hypothetical protein